MADDTEVTESFPAVRSAGPGPQPPGAPQPPAGPPPGLVADVWPWLAALGVLAAAVLGWLFLVRGHHRPQARAAPNVVGLRERAAIRRLTGAGYGVRSIREPMRRPRGIVGSEASAGGIVTIHVSNGKTPPRVVTTTAATTPRTTTTTTVAAPVAAVPDVTGQTAAAGAGQVEAAGFVAETDPVQGGGPPGAVLRESPPGGTQARAGETVTLGVAVGASRPAVQIPNVVGQTAAAARASLLRSRLTVRTTYRHGKTGVVLGESPGGSVPEWTQVTLSVGR